MSDSTSRTAALAEETSAAVQYIECPEPYLGALPGVFLAGGITGCPSWQPEAAALLAALADTPIAIFNPARAHFPIHDPHAASEQINWEFNHLRTAEVILFWFPASGLVPQPIVLYELGRHAALGRRIAVGADPDYIRRDDVVVQLGLARPDLIVHDTLPDTCHDAAGLIHAVYHDSITIE